MNNNRGIKIIISIITIGLILLNTIPIKSIPTTLIEKRIQHINNKIQETIYNETPSTQLQKNFDRIIPNENRETWRNRLKTKSEYLDPLEFYLQKLTADEIKLREEEPNIANTINRIHPELRILHEDNSTDDSYIHLKSIPDNHNPNSVHNINTSEDFSSIQEAIDDPDTKDGHTIIVDPGIYYENIIVDKSLTILGSGKDVTIIDGNDSDDVVNIVADDVNFSYFTIRNSGPYPDAGLHVSSSYNSIVGNRLSEDYYGLRLDSSNDNNILDNEITDNGCGICLDYSSGNIISSCNTSYNGYGIRFWSSGGNVVSNCVFIDDGVVIRGDVFSDFNNSFRNNSVNGKPLLYYYDKHDVVLDGVEVGEIILVNCNGFKLRKIDISNTNTGIEAVSYTHLTLPTKA